MFEKGIFLQGGNSQPCVAGEEEQPLPPRRLSRLPPPPVGSWRPAGEQSQAGKGTGKGSPALASSLLKIQQGHLKATTWVIIPAVPPGETESGGGQSELHSVTCLG